jgi:hypothetical protein
LQPNELRNRRAHGEKQNSLIPEVCAHFAPPVQNLRAKLVASHAASGDAPPSRRANPITVQWHCFMRNCSGPHSWPRSFLRSSFRVHAAQ